MRFLFLILLSVFNISAYALAGSPSRIYCSARGSEATLDIPYLHDLIKRVCGDEGGSCDIRNVILSFTNRVELFNQATFECDKYNGKVSNCLARSGEGAGNLAFTYGFNSQFGSLNISDLATGVEVSSNWLNQYDVTNSGYLHTWISLTNYQGGLLGNPQLYKLTVTCYASQKEWQR
jgi:hypothetical protein